MSEQSTKNKIIQTSIRLFSTKGYDKTTAGLIAKELNISQSNIFYHFKNKILLFEGTLKYIINSNKEVFELTDHPEREHPYETLIRLLNSHIRWAYKFPEQAKIILMLFNFSTWDDNFKHLSTKTIDITREKIYLILIQINKINPIDSPLSLERISEILQQYVNSVVFQLLCYEDRVKIKNSFKSDINVLLCSLLNTPSQPADKNK